MKAVLFDMSGVIADAESFHTNHRAKKLEEYGIFATQEDHQATVGIPLREQLAYFSQKYGVELPYEQISAELREIQAKEHHRIKMCAGAESLIRLLQGHFKLAVVSSNLEKSVKEMLENFGIRAAFDAVVCVDSRTPRMVQREIYAQAAKDLGIDANECLLVEDSADGIRTGRELGMKTIAVPNKYNKKADFSAANLVVNSLEEVTLETINRVFQQ